MDYHADEIKLIGSVLRAINIVGVAATKKHVEKLFVENIRFDDIRVERVVCAVATEFNITTYEVIFGTQRSNERRLAVGFCAYYLINSFGYDVKVVKDKLKKEKTVIYRMVGMVKKLNSKHAALQKYYEIKIKLDTLFPIKK